VKGSHRRGYYLAPAAGSQPTRVVTSIGRSVDRETPSFGEKIKRRVEALEPLLAPRIDDYTEYHIQLCMCHHFGMKTADLGGIRSATPNLRGESRLERRT
jgi:hypothetical protein